MTRTGARASLVLAGILLLTAGFWAGRSLTSRSVPPQVQTGTVRFVGLGGQEFAFRAAGTPDITSYALPAPVWWRNAFGGWSDTGQPSCMRSLTQGQRITIGVLNAAPAGAAPGGPVIVWLECAAKPVPRYPIVSPSAAR